MFPRTLISSDSEQLKDYGDGGTPSFGSSNYGAGPPLSPIDRPLDWYVSLPHSGCRG